MACLSIIVRKKTAYELKALSWLARSPFVLKQHISRRAQRDRCHAIEISLYWASECSERDTYRSKLWKSEIYIYSKRDLTLLARVLRNVGGVKCQQYLQQ